MPTFTYLVINERVGIDECSIDAKNIDEATEKIRKEFIFEDDISYESECVDRIYLFENYSELPVAQWQDEREKELEKREAVANYAQSCGEGDDILDDQDEYEFLKRRIAELESRMENESETPHPTQRKSKKR